MLSYYNRSGIRSPFFFVLRHSSKCLVTVPSVNVFDSIAFMIHLMVMSIYTKYILITALSIGHVRLPKGHSSSQYG